MARTITKQAGHGTGSEIVGTVRMRFLEMDITSYAAGGESMTAAEAGLSSIIGVLGIVKGGATVLRVPQWDATNNKVLVAETGAAVSGPLSELEAAATAKLFLIVVGY